MRIRSGSVRNAKVNGRFLQRGALFFIILTLVFGLVEPGVKSALARSGDTEFNTNYKIDPLNSSEQKYEAAPTEITGEPLETPKTENPSEVKGEDVSLRTAFSSTYVNNDGSRTMKYSSRQQNYLVGNKWQKIDNSLEPVQEKAPDPTLWQSITNTQPKAPEPKEYKGKAGSNLVNIKSLASGITIQSEGKTITMKPVGARDVKPIKLSDSSILYKDAWPNVDIEYELHGETIKEIIILKNKNVKTNYTFSVSGGKVIHHPTRPGELTIEGLPKKYSFSALTLNLQDRGVISEQRVSQSPTADGKGIAILVDGNWLSSQPDSSFPMRIDPTYNKEAQTYWMFKSDGYGCNASNCYANVGTINDGGWKHWRTYFQFPFSNLAGKKILNATLHGYFKGGANGDTAGRQIWMGHANCVSFNCRGTQVGWAGGIGTDFDINFTGGLQESVNNGDWGTVWSLWGEEGPYKSFKPYLDLVAYTTYDTPTPQAQPASPTNAQVVVDTQPTLKVGAIGDADGDGVEYYFRVSTKPDAETGAVINSGWINTPQWTIPEGILQDGTTYYWHTYTRGATQTDPTWTRSFKVDLRTGKDSTQSYDAVGPVSIDIGTGNATLANGTHSMSALGGDMGLSFTYNTPNRAKKGLKGEYWNVSSNYNINTGAPNSTPNVTSRVQNIDFDWGLRPLIDGVNTEWAYARWTGQFVAPVSGNYKFGGSNDDGMKVTVNNVEQYNQACYSGICYNEANSITLTAGQVVPLQIDFLEAVGNAYARLYVKGAVAEQVVSSEWLYTNPISEPTAYGLTGRYYIDTGDRNIDTAATDPSRLMMVRRDTNLNLNFGNGGPAQGLATDNFLVRWTGYITVPIAGSYTLGMRGDDGSRIKIKNGADWSTVFDSWGYTNDSNRWGSAVTLPANTPIPISIDYNEVSGPASFNLIVQDTKGAQSNMPTTWLTPNATVLPSQWSMGIDAGGSVSYERIRIASNSVILEDSTGSTHEYTYTDGGYAPPKGEDGTLSRNSNNSYTYVDTDGRTYVFDASGNLVSLTSPADGKQPAALKYEYAGDPSRLVRIQDGVTNTRDAVVYYKGVNDTNNICNPENSPNSPATFFGLFAQFDQAPNGMLCALKTSDGKVTNLYYKNGHLARIIQPGGQITDYAYDSLGRITTVRDPLAADAIGASVRDDDTSVTTELSYDNLGRIASVKAPSATQGGSRIERKIGYLPSSQAPLSRFISPSNGYHYGTTANEMTGYRLEFRLGYVMTRQQADTVPIYSCMVDSIDQMVSLDANCEGQTKLGLLGFVYSNSKPQPANTTPLYRCRIGPDHFISTTSNCEGQIVEFFLGYLHNDKTNAGTSEMRVVGASEPLGYSRRIEYDTLLRTTVDTDLTGKSTQTKWDTTKDLQLSTTDPTGLMSTTIYDKDDRAVESYGPAPVAWYDSTSRKPLAAYANQISKTSTGYDQGFKGPSVTWYNLKSNNMTLVGAPKAYTSGFTSSNNPSTGGAAFLNHDYRSSPLPMSVDSGHEGYGFTATGKLRFSQSGTYTFTATTDDSVKLLINDKTVLSNWGTKTSGSTRNTLSGSYVFTAGEVYRFTYQYGHEGMADMGDMGLSIAGPGISGATRNWEAFLEPGYNLPTSSTVEDSVLGSITNTTQYSDPAYGQISGNTLDPSGLNYTSQATYEAPGTGYLRQTSKVLAGGATTTYLHYGGTDVMDNPCTSENESFGQAGMAKGKIDPTGRSTETIYNNSGDIVAIRYDNELWTCVTYDDRGRVISNVIPSSNGKSGRTVLNNYAVGGNPLITSSSDESGSIITEVDLLGRTIKYTDVKNNITTNSYDDFGKIISRTSPVGVESFEYDGFDRLVKQKLDGTTFSTITYDEFSRVNSVIYPGGINLLPATRDALGRINKLSYSVNGQIISDEISRSTAGFVVSGIENGINKSYQYDKAARLISATIGNNTLAYGFGAPSSTCTAPGTNQNAAKDGNRSSFTLNGVVTSYCYNSADQLISSTDNRFSQVEYDSRGNITRLGDDNHKTELSYDVSDRNTEILESTPTSTRQTEYQRDVTDRIYHRAYKVDSVTVQDAFYGFNSSNDSPSFLTDSNGNVIQKYLSLAGGIKVTISPQSTSAGATTFTISNIQGNAMATVNADGLVTIVVPNGPFGEKLPAHTAPVNAAVGVSSDYLSIANRSMEKDYLIQPIQMGSRVYIPELGRFTRIDPIEGGTMNAYVYALDPVNQADSGGKLIFVPILISTLATIVFAAIAANSVKKAVKNPTPENITIAVIDTVGAVTAPATGGASIAVSKGASAGVRATGAAAKAAQLAANKAAGKEAERIAFERAKALYAKEYEVVAQKYLQVDGFPRGRFADIAIMKGDQPILLIEVKSGNAKYGGTQQLKDQAILEQYGAPTQLQRIPLTKE